LVGAAVELRQVRYFVEVARARHFTRAAEVVGVAQPALSQQVRALERELGVALLERTSRRVRLTPAGEVFFARAEQLLADAAQAQLEMQEFAGLTRGRVVVGVVPSLEERWLADLLAGFSRLYPGVELVLREETTGELVDLTNRGDVDLALVHIGEGGSWPGLDTAPLFDEDLVIAVAPDHPLAHQERVDLWSLRDERWILLKPGSVVRQSVIDASAALGFTPRITFESSAVGPIRALAAVGLGIAVLPRSVAEADGPPIAVVRLDPPLTRTLGLAWRKTGYRARPSSAFLEYARRQGRRP
jgi:DNA-binding transcriptional LysR family regulator